MNPIPFYKMSGCGNDFIIIDNRTCQVPVDELPVFASRVCQRKMSVGADGLILVESSERADFKWRFFNADGSVAEMCGNGARCVARFAVLRSIAGPQMTFETLAGMISATVLNDQVRIQMTDPFDLVAQADLVSGNRNLVYSSINTGVPHVVMEVDDLETVDVVALGRQIRHHPGFAPAGTNVNFIARLDDRLWGIRTYERGVEDETLACGTGVTAAALTLAARYGLLSPVCLKTRSNGLLTIHFTQNGGKFSPVYMEGDARVVYQGQLWPEAWQYA
jgi:diaminopimelate epimerase